MKRVFFKSTKVLVIAMIIIMTFLSLCACGSKDNASVGSTASNSQMLNIAVIKYKENADYDSAYRGFVSALSDKGYIDGETIKLKVTCCGGDKEKCNNAVKAYVEEKPDLIYTIGQIPAVSAAKATEDIPIIFSFVEDPIKAGLVKSSEKPEKNVTGVSNFTPVYEQLRLITQIWPNAKKISALHSETGEKSILFAALANEEAKSLGLEAVSYPVKDKDHINSALEDALKKCDVLYVYEDAVTKKCIKTIIKEANAKKIPVLSSSEAFLENGAFGTCVPDYHAHGYSAGEMALVVLKDLKPISEIPVLYSDACKVVLSESTEDDVKVYASLNSDSVEIR